MWKKLFGKTESKPIVDDEEKVIKSKFEEDVYKKLTELSERFPVLNDENKIIIRSEVKQVVKKAISSYGLPPLSEKDVKESQEKLKVILEKDKLVGGIRDESNKFLKEFRKTKLPYNREYVYHVIKHFVYSEAFMLLGTPVFGGFFNRAKSILNGEYSLFENTIFKKNYDVFIDREVAKNVENELYKFCFLELPELMKLPKLPSGEYITSDNRKLIHEFELMKISDEYDYHPFTLTELIEQKIQKWAFLIVK